MHRVKIGLGRRGLHLTGTGKNESFVILYAHRRLSAVFNLLKATCRDQSLKRSFDKKAMRLLPQGKRTELVIVKTLYRHY